ncbi:outer membrane beta-barrel protein, partial [Acinetobacter baumannii]
YDGSTLSEDELRATLGVEYFLNRETVLFSRYVHTAFSSTAPDAGYDADEIRIGVRLRR